MKLREEKVYFLGIRKIVRTINWVQIFCYQVKARITTEVHLRTSRNCRVRVRLASRVLKVSLIRNRRLWITDSETYPISIASLAIRQQIKASPNPISNKTVVAVSSKPWSNWKIHMDWMYLDRSLFLNKIQMITRLRHLSRLEVQEDHPMAAKIRSSSMFLHLKWPPALAILVDNKFNMLKSRKVRMQQTVKNMELPIRSNKIKMMVKTTRRKHKIQQDQISWSKQRRVSIPSHLVEMLVKSLLTKILMLEQVSQARKWSLDLDRVTSTPHQTTLTPTWCNLIAPIKQITTRVFPIIHCSTLTRLHPQILHRRVKQTSKLKKVHRSSHQV